ncbi:unnamed protein product [Orchesella dallaii]|uniref:DnaJ homolog subfamily C member 16 n=1 Tax=Orchesella dallaii TaxID=48710 RepID=A0ABP1S907_9HEXA
MKINRWSRSTLSWKSLFLISLCIVSVFVWVSSAYGVTTASGSYNPYEVLGVKRSASPQEIRKAYKQLVVLWHPDKNKEGETEDKFILIKSAYELLSDPERRRLYDQHGITEDSPNLNPRPDYNNFHKFDPIDEILTFTTGGSFHFPFADGISYLHKQSITSKTFDQNVLPRSNIVPQLLLFYGDWCTGCARAAPTWRSISEELSNVGMDVACVHAERERVVARRMGISAVPAVVLVIDSHPYHYRETVISASKVIGFIRSKLPFDLITHLDQTNVDIFLNSWWDNRIRVIIFGSTPLIRLRYLLLAFQYRERAAFGIIRTDESPDLVHRFGVTKGLDSILVFKEYAKPVASLSMLDIPHKLMKDLVENNKFLNLPRLSSQSIMDTICPTESSVYRRRLCVVFLTRDTTKLHDEEKVEQLRQYATRPSLPSRVKFAYVYEDKQRDFISALSSGNVKDSNLLIIWRQDKKRLSYEWMEGGWDGSNSSIQRLDNVLYRLMTDRSPLAYHVEIKELTDEHARSIFSKVLRKISLTMDFLRGQITREMVIQATSLVATVLFIVAGGFIMAYLVRLEEESILAKANADAQRAQRPAATRPSTQSTTRPSSAVSSITHNPECRIHEMRGETYNGLVRLIKPGCRTVVLLLDAETKSELLPKFQRCVWPYRKNKSLQFGYMHVDRGGGLSWYKQLLLLSLAEPRNLNINPRNCVGTVLSLNGHRKYFCVFHATLPTAGAPRRRAGSGYRNGGFLGMDSENSSDECSDVERGGDRANPNGQAQDNVGVLFTSHLLDNLPNWLDRLFEGSTHRYHINYWPEFPVK